MERARVVVLVSGSGTNLQALVDAAADPSYPAEVVAVGSDLLEIPALGRAEAADIETFTVVPDQHPSRAAWDLVLADTVAVHLPDFVVMAGFMRLVGPVFLERFPHRVINTHPALLPAFAGLDAPQQAVDYGAKVTGCTIFVVDEGVDTGPIVAQAAVPVVAGDDRDSLHDRIKQHERQLLVDTVANLATHPYRIDGRKVVWT